MDAGVLDCVLECMCEDFKHFEENAARPVQGMAATGRVSIKGLPYLSVLVTLLGGGSYSPVGMLLWCCLDTLLPYCMSIACALAL